MPHNDHTIRIRPRLRLEPLEAREVPAVLVSFTDGGNTLTIAGDGAANAVLVRQNDRADTLTVTGAGANPAVFRASAIGTVVANLGAGDDRFEYATTGAVRTAKRLRVDMGDDDDTAKVRWSEDGGPAKAGLTAFVSGGAGSDAIGFRVGEVAPGVAVAIRADGGAGNDAVASQALAPGRGASLDVALRGGDGNDNVATYATGDLPAGGRADYDLSGGTGDDSISIGLGGRVAGLFGVRADGGAGDDELALTAVDVAGPGKLNAALSGGDGNDRFVTLADARTAVIAVDGGAGTDGGLILAGAKVRGIEQSQAPGTADLLPGPLPTFNPVLPTATLTRDGRTVEYYSAGRSAPGAPVVVLLTGFGGTIDYWQKVPGLVAASSQVIAVNRPGYGKSSPATGDYGTATVEDIRAAVRAAAGDRSVVLVGHSLGGMYANLFARLHPDEVAGVVFVDATPPETVVLAERAGFPNAGLGDPADPALRLQPVGYSQEVVSAVATARGVVAAPKFPAVPVVSLRARYTAEATAADPATDALYTALGSLGTPGETRIVSGAGHNVQYDRPDSVVEAVAKVVRLATEPAATALPLAPAVRDTLSEVRAATGVPAVAGGVIVGGRTAGVGAVGVREAGKPATVTDDDRFHLGSNAKSMTATLAAVLVERGTIRWDATVGQSFPELRGRIQPGYANATLEDLLNHRGGFGDFTNLADIAQYQRFQKAARFAFEGRQAYVRDWLATRAPANPRGVYNYSNIGYAVAGAMMERAAGRGFEWLMREQVFRPLGMTGAVFGLPAQDGRTGQTLGHDENGNPIPASRTEPLDLLSPSGGVSMTMADWAKYLRMQLGERVNGVRLLSAESLRKLHTPDPRAVTDTSGTFRYGFGWRTAETPLGEALGSEGEVPGFYSRVGIIPSRGLAVFSAVNQLSDAGIAANAAVTDALLGRLAATDALTEALEAARSQHDLPALAGGIIRDGRVLATAATGVRERGGSAAVTADDQFHIGSNGKAITSTLAGVLVDRKLIGWDTTVEQAFPELRRKITPALAKATLEQLLSHRGGFVDENVSPALYEKLVAFRGNAYQARQTYLSEILNTPAGPVGGYSYSNGGYAIAAAMMERMTGSSYEWLMRKYVFDPLGMASAGFGAPGRPGATPDQPRGHDSATGRSVGIGPGAELPAIIDAAGEIHMSVADWGRFLRVHLGETVDGMKLLSDTALAKLHAPDPRPTDSPNETYGFGWVTLDTPYGKALWHNGSNGFWYSEALLIPSLEVAWFAVANQAGDGGETAVRDVVATLQRQTFG